MRIVSAPLLAVALFVAGCATRTQGIACAPDGSYPGGTAAPSAASACIDARTLASRNGLAFTDSGHGVLLESPDLRARFVPGSDRAMLNGSPVLMGEPALRSDGALMIPPAGARAVDQRIAAMKTRRSWAAVKPQATPPPVAPPVLAVARPPAVVPEVKGIKAMAPPRTPASGDPSWIPPTTERAWKWIVIHHSDDTSGCASKYHRVHLDKGWENGLGYNFVIGNGSQSGDGEVEVGNRWTQQIQGAHAKTDDNRYNEFGIGIVMVGDFVRGAPSSAQYDACVRLTRWLMARYHITPDRVLRHSDCKSTECPGPGFPWAKFLADVSGGA